MQQYESVCEANDEAQLEECEAQLEEYSRHSNVVEALGGSDVTVLCPMCKKDYILLCGDVFLCKCGLRLDTENDGLTLDHLRSCLERAFSSHRDGCADDPVFSLESTFGGRNLCMRCECCGAFEVVI